MGLKSRLLLRNSITLGLGAVILFLPAGTLKFWEAWVFIAIVFVPMLVFSIYYLKHDPQLVERRLQSREKIREQRVVMKIASLVFILAFLVPGLDHRFGWTQHSAGTVPLWLKVVMQCLAGCGYLLTFWVIDVNRYASRTIQVESGQTIVSSGPYAFVRHPMYAGALVMWLSAPVALGTYVAIPFFVLLIPVIVARLFNEEKVLRRELPGYEAYCRKTRFRLVPYVW